MSIFKDLKQFLCTVVVAELNQGEDGVLADDKVEFFKIIILLVHHLVVVEIVLLMHNKAHYAVCKLAALIIEHPFMILMIELESKRLVDWALFSCNLLIKEVGSIKAM